MSAADTSSPCTWLLPGHFKYYFLKTTSINQHSPAPAEQPTRLEIWWPLPVTEVEQTSKYAKKCD